MHHRRRAPRPHRFLPFFEQLEGREPASNLTGLGVPAGGNSPLPAGSISQTTISGPNQLGSDSSLFPTAGVTFVDWSIVPPASATTPASAPSNSPVVNDTAWAALANGDAQVFANGLNVPLFGPFFGQQPANGGSAGASASTLLNGGSAGSGGNSGGGGASSSGAGDSGTAGLANKPTVNPVLNSLMASSPVAAGLPPAGASGAGSQPANASGASFQPAGSSGDASAGSKPAATAHVGNAVLRSVPSSGTSPAAQHLSQTFAGLPLAFEQNIGQTDSSVDFLARGQGYVAYVTHGGLTLSLFNSLNTPQQRLDTLGVQFVGANPNATVQGVTDLLSRANYFLGPDPSQAIVNVPEYAGVQYTDVYNGVDLSYHAAGQGQGQIEFDFIVHPGANLSQVQLDFTGASSVQLDKAGNLVLNTPDGSVTERSPTLYQMTATGRQTVQGSFVMHGNQVGFQAGRYDTSLPLYVDPVIDYESYLGGSGTDTGSAITVDQQGNAYLAGTTTSANFPGASGNPPPGQAIFVTKVKADGSGIVYTDIIGSGTSDTAAGIALDATGSVYVDGLTHGVFPTTPGAFQRSFTGSADPFVFKLDATGDALDYSTLAGSGGGSEAVGGLAVTPAGQAVLAGTTDNPSSPTTAGVIQPSYGLGSPEGYVLQLNGTGSALNWATFLGIGGDSLSGVALDGSKNVYLTGTAPGTGATIPTTPGAFEPTPSGSTNEGFVVKLNATATSEAYGTYLGGTSNDQLNAITIAPGGNAVVTGMTQGAYPVTTGAFQSAPQGNGDAVVSELNSSGSALVASTLLGGSSADMGNTVKVDAAGNIWVGGATGSSNFPLQNPTQGTFAGTGDGFVTELNSSLGGLGFSTFLGGASGNTVVSSLALDGSGAATVTGWTTSPSLPVVRAFQANSGGGQDAIVAKYSNTPPPPTFTGISPDTGVSSSDQDTNAQNLTLSGTAAAAATVTLYRAGVGQIGSTTANGSGVWSFNYTATTLPEGVTAFTATDTFNGVTSPMSQPFLVTVDLTPPAVTLTAPATTSSTTPQVVVTASDLNGLPNGTVVTLDVDKNNDGNFTDPGETGFASSTLTNGRAVFNLPALPVGTVQTRARVTDRAGNQGTSSVVSVQVNSSVAALTAWVPTADPLQGDALLQNGDLQISHPLDLDQSPGTSQSGDPALVYNSTAADPRPVVQGTLQLSSTASVPSYIQVQLTWDGVVQSTQNYSTSGLSAGQTLTVAAQVASPVTAVGRHAWSLQVTLGTSPNPTVLTQSGATYVVPQQSSPYGAGWTLSMVDRLYSIAQDGNGPAGVLRAYGSGGWSFYQAGSGNSYTSPSGDNGTLVALQGGGWTYTTPDGQVTTFNSSGLQTGWQSADGFETMSWTYSGSALASMTAIDGAVSTFGYTNGVLTSISTVGPRTWTIGQSNGNLTSITDPDNGQRTFSYDTGHHLTGDSFVTLTDAWGYNSTTGLLQSDTAGDGGATTITAAASVGLSGPTAQPAQASVTDAVQRTTTTALDTLGRTLQVIDAEGGLTSYQLDSNGRVTQVTDPMQRVTGYVRDSLGYVTQENLPGGATISYVYQTAFHALTSETNELGGITSYTYDTQGHETSVTDPYNDTTSYTWANGLLQTVTDAYNRVVDTYNYDSDRRQIKDTDYYNNYTAETYDGNGNVATERDKDGNVTSFVNDAMGRVTKETDAITSIVTQWVYNGAGLETSTTDANGNVTQDSYNARGLLTQQVVAAGSATPVTQLDNYDAAGQEIAARNGAGWWTQTSYDALGDVSLSTDAYGNTVATAHDLDGEVTATRDQLGNTSTQSYNVRGWVVSSTDAAHNTTTETYDNMGDVLTVTDAANHVTTTAYDKMGRATQVTDALNHSSYTTYDKEGNVATTTDFNGVVTDDNYDALNRLTSVVEAAGTSKARTTSTTYDAAGNVLTQTDGDGKVTHFAYDALNRQISTTDANNNTTQTGYDSDGNVTSTTDALNKVTTYSFNALNEQISSTDPNNHVTQTAFDGDGNAVQTTDAAGAISYSAFDELDRLVGSTDANGAVTGRGYDGAGNLTSLTDPDKNVTTWQYDADNRVTTQTDPLGHSILTTYNSAGLVASITNRDGMSQTFSYDADNRLTTNVWKNASNTVVDTLTYGYDNNGNLTSAGDNNGSYTRTYDVLNQVTAQTDPFNVTLTIGYDAAGYRTSVTDSQGGTVSSVYDAGGRLTRRTFSGTNLPTMRIDLGYNGRDQLTSLSRYADLGGTQLVGTSALGYDNAGNLTSLQHKDGSGTNLANYVNAFDADNRITSETRNGGTPTTYSYDATSQLTSDGTTTYSFDANGNRNMSGYVIGADNRLSTDGTWNYSYDNEGNVVKKVNISTGLTWTYSYDNLNRLLSAVQRQTDGGTLLLTLGYKYDVFGNLIEEDRTPAGQGTTVTRHSYDDQGNLWADLNSSNSIQTRYIRGDDPSQIFARVTSTTVNWLLQDREGSVRDVANASGSVIDTITYSSFGAITSQSNSASTGEFGYTGQLFSVDTGLMFTQWRVYDPTTGTWLQEDPSGISAGDPNFRRYVGNDPTNATDPSGLDTKWTVKSEYAKKSSTELKKLIKDGTLKDNVELLSVTDDAGNKFSVHFRTAGGQFYGLFTPNGKKPIEIAKCIPDEAFNKQVWGFRTPKGDTKKYLDKITWYNMGAETADINVTTIQIHDAAWAKEKVEGKSYDEQVKFLDSFFDGRLVSQGKLADQLGFVMKQFCTEKQQKELYNLIKGRKTGTVVLDSRKYTYDVGANKPDTKELKIIVTEGRPTFVWAAPKSK